MAITMQVTNSLSKRYQSKLIAAFGLSFFSIYSYSSDWNFDSSLTVSERYTSNLSLDHSDEVSSFITTVSPGFSLNRQGARVQSNINYSMNILNYSANEGDDDLRHSLNAGLNSELVEKHLFVDASANISQQFLSTNDSAAGSIDSLNANTTETYTFRISPYWQQKIGDDASALFRITYNSVSFDSDSANDRDSLNYDVSFDFEPSASKVSWGVEVDQNQSEADGGSDSTARSTNAFIGYKASSQLSTRFSYGYVENDIDSASDSRAEDGDFWGVTADWTPSPVTSINASYNSRLQTNTDYGLRLNRKIKGGAFVLDYSEGISDFESEISSLSPPYTVLNTETLDTKEITSEGYQLQENETVIGNPASTVSITDDKFINKSLNADLTFVRGKSTYTLGAFHTNRAYQTGSIDEETDIGVNLGWNNRLNRRMSSSLNFSWSEIELSDDNKDQLNSISFSLNRTLSRKTSAAIDINFRSRESDVSTREYDEYGLGLNLTHSF